MKVLISTICSSKLFTINYAQSIFFLQSTLANYGLDSAYWIKSDDSLLYRARNNVANVFLEKKNFDYLLMIDSDMGWDCKDIADGIIQNYPVLGFTAPEKRLDGRHDYHSEQYISEDDKDSRYRYIHGCGAGILIIPRQTLLTMSEDALPLTHDFQNPINGIHYDFFSPIITQDGEILPEDYSFSYRVAKSGMKIFVDTEAKLTHAGIHVFL